MKVPQLNRNNIVALLGLALFPCLGCVTLDQHTARALPPQAPVHQIQTLWENQIVVTPDSVNGGTPLPGIVCRLYLFGPDLGYPVQGDGKVIVDLYDPAKPGPDGQPQKVERWELDKDTLKRLMRKDRIGWGYTLFLPWSGYRPDKKHVQLQVCYQPDQGQPIYAPTSSLTLRSDPTPYTMRETTIPLPTTTRK